MGKGKTGYSERLDRAGLILSWACFAHCVALPFALAALPLSAASVLVSEEAEWVVIGFTFAVGLLALVPAYFRYHRSLTSLMLFAAGLALIIAADPLSGESLAGRSILLAAGAAGVTAAHLLNRRLCRSCVSCAAGRHRS